MQHGSKSNDQRENPADFGKNPSVQIDLPFSINEVRLNSGLNSDFMKALDGAAENVYDFMSLFVADYELNHRQIALYLIDCELL